MAVDGSAGSRRYSFEKYRPLQETRRDNRRSANDAEILLERLGQPEPEGGYSKHPLFPRIRDYCAEVTINIDWYEERRKTTEKQWKRTVFFVIAAGLVAATTATVLSHMLNTALAVTIFLAPLLPALQGLASAVDFKARMGSFWKAASDLKELLFLLEEAWRGKDLVKDKVLYVVEGRDVERTFEEVLRLDRITARHICRAERETFFNTFKSPADVVAKFSESLSALRNPMDVRALRPETLPPPPTPPLSALATHLKTTAEELSQLVKELEDPEKRPVALARAATLFQGLSKELYKPK